jgi:hypothetical protein
MCGARPSVIAPYANYEDILVGALIRIVLCAALCSATATTWAGSSAKDEEQNRAYLNCLIHRKVYPPNIPKEDSELCLREAGIEDPGEVARKEKGQAWRNCLVTHAVRLDDGVSPAPDIARAIIQLCSSEWRGYVNALWMPPEPKQEMANGLEKYAVGEGVQAVLLTRRTLRDIAASKSKEKP